MDRGAPGGMGVVSLMLGVAWGRKPPSVREKGGESGAFQACWSKASLSHGVDTVLCSSGSAALPGIAHRKVSEQIACPAPRAYGVSLGLSIACPPLVLWGWQLVFDFADQGVQGLARDGDQLPFLGNRDRGRQGLHVETPAFVLISEGVLSCWRTLISFSIVK